MIRTNLATRPFYNERAVHAVLLAVAGVVVVASIFNTTRVMRYSRSDTQLSTQASRDESRAVELRTAAARLRTTVDPKQIASVSIEAREANDLIDRRTFSWTELFNHFETTLPEEVRITSLRPRIEKDQLFVTVTVVARGAEDISRFMDNLQETGAFAQVGSSLEEHVNEQGQLQVAIQAVYVPMVGHAAGRGGGAGRRR
jgi:Tfp pilus assembly protein PilN